MFFCATMMSWRGGVLRSFCILCPRGRAATGEPSIFTQQTVSVPLCLRVRVRVFSYTTEVCISFLSSGNLQPQSIVKPLVPSWNTLVLFEVSPVSFHQVRINILVFTISLERLRLEITLFGVSFFFRCLKFCRRTNVGCLWAAGFTDLLWNVLLATQWLPSRGIRTYREMWVLSCGNISKNFGRRILYVLFDKYNI